MKHTQTAARKVAMATALTALIALSACGVNDRKIVMKAQTAELAAKATVNPNATESHAITASITMKKSALELEYFYGSDLQYSSIYDKDMDLYNQSESFGHIPVSFRRNGNELQLVADNRRLFPSDVNHPEQLISRYKILSETADTITISEADSSLYLNTIADSKKTAPKDHWARSFEYVAQGNYLLQETSIVLADGTIAEFMESVFPRETLKPSKSFELFKMDPEDDVGGDEGAVARYRLLNGETIYNGEEKLAYAQHYDLQDANGKDVTIDWYVTPNIKDEDLDVVKHAVEGWNRYFRNFKGINRDVVLFKGRMPTGMKLGDPRYNIINWDSRLVAGAAYESQANDPFTGKQSHSVIYMPVAWFQIGMDYWKNGQFSDKETAASSSAAPTHARFNCYRDLRGAAAELASGRMKEAEMKAFSIQLMKQTLFHEVGHALGLAHNFKGSLTFDRSDSKSMFSSSIMDYNDYEIERGAFDSPTTAEGPQLEYDRQALSAIYNKMADVKSSDAVMPACNDAEADTEESGSVDPLCLRYDIEKDPTHGISTAFARVNEETLDGDVTLSQALLNASKDVLAESELAKADTKEKHEALQAKYIASMKGAMAFYYVSGKASVSRTVRNNVKSLYVFADDVLPKEYSEREMRERAFNGVKDVIAINALSPSVITSMNQIAGRSAVLLAQTAYAKTLATAEATALAEKSMTALSEAVKKFVVDPSSGLVKLKVAVLGTIARNNTLPLFFGKVGDANFDFETAIATLLYETTVDKTRAKEERLAAATSLVTYKKRLEFSSLITKAHDQATGELIAAGDNKTREFAQKLKGILE